MLSRTRELWYALAAIVVVTALYVFVWRQAGVLPPAFGFVGHGIGVVGFLLMLVTETAYSIRKQITTANWGSMAAWLRFHIVTGLVGPYMVLLHTTIRFQGLAGVTMLLTAVVVASGIVGRYLYTSVPRTVAQGLAGGRSALATWHTLHVPVTWVLFALAFVHVLATLFYATFQR